MRHNKNSLQTIITSIQVYNFQKKHLSKIARCNSHPMVHLTFIFICWIKFGKNENIKKIFSKILFSKRDVYRSFELHLLSIKKATRGRF